MLRSLLLLLLALPICGTAVAQQRLGYVDTEVILARLPEYATIQQQIDRLAQEWERELVDKQKEVDELFRQYQARELLYTNEERRRKREEIARAEEDLERSRLRYFGPEGQLFTEQDNLLRPVQDRLLEAIEEVAKSDGYDFVFDLKGEYLFLFAREQYDLSNRVLEELGIDIEVRTN